MKDKKKSKRDILRENDELKLRISQEFGGMFEEDSNLSPDLENQFLKNVMAFEEQFAEGKQTTVYERIGAPSWVPVDKIDDSNIGRALNDLRLKLGENGISIDAICEVDEREMYRFITEELFLHKIDDLSIKGMMTCFIYEEFHPNHEYDAEQAVTDFITRTLLRKNDTDDWFFNENLRIQLSPEIGREKTIRDIKNFINAWSGFEIHHFKITSTELTEDIQIAHVTFEITYDATMEDDSDTISYEGTGKMKLENMFQRLECVGWNVLNCEIPGFTL